MQLSIPCTFLSAGWHQLTGPSPPRPSDSPDGATARNNPDAHDDCVWSAHTPASNKWCPAGQARQVACAVVLSPFSRISNSRQSSSETTWSAHVVEVPTLYFPTAQALHCRSLIKLSARSTASPPGSPPGHPNAALCREHVASLWSSSGWNCPAGHASHGCQPYGATTLSTLATNVPAPQLMTGWLVHVRAASVVDLNVGAAHAAHTPSAVALGGCARCCPGLHVFRPCADCTSQLLRRFGTTPMNSCRTCHH